LFSAMFSTPRRDFSSGRKVKVTIPKNTGHIRVVLLSSPGASTHSHGESDVVIHKPFKDRPDFWKNEDKW